MGQFAHLKIIMLKNSLLGFAYVLLQILHSTTKIKKIDGLQGQKGKGVKESSPGKHANYTSTEDKRTGRKAKWGQP